MIESVPLSAPDLTDKEIQAVVSVLLTDRLSIGPHIEAFEAAIAARAGRKHGVGVTAAPAGLHLCVRALGIGEGDEVITTPFSFVATTNCLLFERRQACFRRHRPGQLQHGPCRHRGGRHAADEGHPAGGSIRQHRPLRRLRDKSPASTSC